MERKPDIDLHGYTVLQAIRSVEDLLTTRSTLRSDSIYTAEPVKIITGNGEIRIALMDYFDAHGYEWMFENSVNTGCILVFV